MPDPHSPDAPETIHLKDPALAAFLAWLIPGLGHLYQGRLAKAALFFVCIMGTFAYGVYLGGNWDLGYGRVVYFSWRTEDRRLPFLCQIGIGLPALPAAIQWNRVRNGRAPLFGGFMAPPRLDQGPADQPTLHDLHRQLHRYFELGTVYTMIGGLLNILAIYDAGAGPVMSEKRRKEDDEDQKQDEDDKKDKDKGKSRDG